MEQTSQTMLGKFNQLNCVEDLRLYNTQYAGLAQLVAAMVLFP
jgi:hypothetical protein